MHIFQHIATALACVLLLACADDATAVLDISNLGTEKVLLRPARYQTISTSGTATETVSTVQQVRLSAHQVLELQLNGSPHGDTYTIEVCTFDYLLPGHVQYAPSLGNRDQIVVVTDGQNVTDTYVKAGVSGDYPVRISTNMTEETQHSHVYLINLDECPESDIRVCIFTVPLSQNYVGDSINNGNGGVWGCSWTPTASINHDATQADVHAKIKAVLGDSLLSTNLEYDSFDDSFNITLTMAEGVQDVYARLNIALLQGSAMSVTSEEISAGYAVDVAFNEISGWGGTFKLAMATNSAQFTAALSPGSTAKQLEDALRALDSVSAGVKVTKATDGRSWQVTFEVTKGDVALLHTFYDDMLPIGIRIEVTKLVAGKAKVSGQFELQATTATKAALNLADTVAGVQFNDDEAAMVANLELLGFKDVKVSRDDATPSNGYTWSVTFLGDCPLLAKIDSIQTDPACNDVRLEEGPVNGLQGNNATLALTDASIASLNLADFNISSTPVGPIEWILESYFPSSLNSNLPTIRNPANSETIVDFPISTTGAFTYVLKDSGAGDRIVLTTTIFTDSRRPYAYAGPDLIVPKTALGVSGTGIEAVLNSTGSAAYYDATIVSYQWVRVGGPSLLNPNVGTVTSPSNSITSIENLDVPGVYVYELTVTDSLAYISRDTVNVNAQFSPGVGTISDKNAVPGDNVTMICVGSGSTPLSYKWYFNSNASPITGQSLSQLVLLEVTEEDEGTYTCEVSNAVGAIKSNAAALDVFDPPTDLSAMGDARSIRAYPGMNVDLVCNVTGQLPIQYIWEQTVHYSELIWASPFGAAGELVYGDATYTLSTDANWTAIGGATGTSRILSLLSITDASNEGVYRCRATNIVTETIIEPMALVVADVPSNVVLDVSPAAALTAGVMPGATLELTCKATGQVDEYKWVRTSDPDFTSSGAVLTFTNITYEANGGEYYCTATNAAGTGLSETKDVLIFSPPIFTVHPVGAVLDPLSNYTFETQVIGMANISFLWTKNGQYLPQNVIYKNSLILENLAENFEGVYTCVAWNELGYTESNPATLLINDPPLIDQQPVDTGEIDPGQNTELYCSATGSLPLTFSWVFRANSGEDSYVPVAIGQETVGDSWSRLTVEDVEPSHESEYACVVTNSAGSILSDFALLSVSEAPSIIQQPVDSFVDPGETAIFETVASGADPLTYQWRKDGVNMPGETGSVLTIVNVQTEDEAVFDCRITNRLNANPGLLTHTAWLRIATEPLITGLAPALTIVNPGDDTSLLGKVLGAPPLTLIWFDADTNEVISNFTSDEGDFDASLIFSEVTEENDRRYKLRAENRIGQVESGIISLQVNDIPEITNTLVTQRVNPGDDTVIDCVVVGVPAPEVISWFVTRVGKSNEEVVVTNTASGGTVTSSLTVTNVTENDEGQYSCAASNTAGSFKKIVLLLIVRDPPFDVLIHEPVGRDPEGEEPANIRVLQVDTGERVLLKASSQGQAVLEYEWLLNGAVVSALSTSTQYLIEVAGSTHEGVYTVRVVNGLGESTSAIGMDLRLNLPAQVDSLITSPESGRVRIGESVELTCAVSGTKPFIFVWTRNGIPLLSDSSSGILVTYDPSSDAYTSTVFIYPIDVNLAGTYGCKVTNSANVVGDSIETSVVALQAPVLLANSPKDVDSFPGTNTSIVCEVSVGSPPFQVQWYRGVAPLAVAVPDGTFKFEGSSHEALDDMTIPMDVRNVLDEDEDLYSCTVCNELGCATSREAQLNVYNAPVIVAQVPPADQPTLSANPATIAKISVTASGMEPMTFVWSRKNGAALGSLVSYEPADCSASEVPCNLVFTELQPEDEGIYVCTVTNNLGQAVSQGVSVLVNKPPSLKDADTWPSQLLTSCPGNPFERAVDVVGTKPIVYEWYFAKAITQASDIFLRSPYQITNSSDFSITDPQDENAGYYAWKAINVAGEYKSSPAQVTVNAGPQAAADASGKSPLHTITLPVTSTTLSGLSSMDLYSVITQYEWAIQAVPVGFEPANVNISSSTSAATKVSGLVLAGTYEFELTVTNEGGCSDQDTVTVRVNTPPVPVADDVTIAVPAQAAVLDATRTYDPDIGDTIVANAWTLLTVDGEPALVSGDQATNVIIEFPTRAITKLFGLAVGVYGFELSVTDSSGAKAVTQVTVTVFSMSILTPAPLESEWVVSGGCTAVKVEWEVQGGLPPNSPVSVYAVDMLVDGGDQYSHTELVSGTLSEFNLNSACTDTFAPVLYEFEWFPGHDVSVRSGQALQIDVVVTIDEDEFVTASSNGSLTISQPYFYEVSAWSECVQKSELLGNFTCGLGIRTRTALCAGLASSRTCKGMREVVYKSDQHCATYDVLPVIEEECELKVYKNCTAHWQISGSWDSSTCHPDVPCQGLKTRTVECVDSGSLEASTLCDMDMKPETELACGNFACPTYSLTTQASLFQLVPPEGKCVVGNVTQPATTQCTNDIDKTPVYRKPSPCGLNDLSESYPTPGTTCTSPFYWHVGFWECEAPESSAQALRDVVCVDATSWDTVLDSSCEGAGDKPADTSLFACATSTNPKTKIPILQWKALDWDSTCDVTRCALKRQVICVEAEGTIETTVASHFCSDAGLPQPSQERACVDENECMQPRGCLFGEITCVRGSCSSANVCECPTDWSGPLCNTPTICEESGGTVDRNNDCCALNNIDALGDCCTGSIDIYGVCCLSPSLLDACGICGGDASVVGLDGTCCSSGILDYSGMCCSSGWLDRCGVCAGSGLSCLIEVAATVSVPTTVVKEGGPTLLGERVLLEAWLFESVQNLTGNSIGNDDIRKFVLTGSVGQPSIDLSGENKRRRLADAEGVLIDVVFGLLPSDGETLLNVISNIDSGLSQFAVGAVVSEPKGVCGNGICEARERCLVSEGIGCCPVDCSIIGTVQTCECGDTGICLPGSGTCSCFRGYQGDNCDECSTGYMSTLGSSPKCVPIAPLFIGVVGSPTSRPSLNPTSTPTDIGNTTGTVVLVKEQTVVTWPIVVLVLLVLVLLVQLWRYYKRNASLDKHGAWVHAEHGDGAGGERNGRRDVECTVELQAWLWKRARVNLEGHHVWQQWYMAVCIPDDEESAPWIEYFDSKRTMSRRLDPDNPTRLLPDPTGQVDGETGVIGLDGLLHVEEHEENKKGYFPFALVFPDTHEGTESHVELLADSSESQAEWLDKLSDWADGPLVPGRKASPGHTSKDKNNKQRILDEELQPALSINDNHQEESDLKASSYGSTESNKLYAEIPDSISVSNVDIEPALTSVCVPPPDAVFGSVSGAVGDRVALEGWMHVSVAGGIASQKSASKWRQLYAVLLADRDELCFFRGMSEAPNGAHAYWAMKHKLSLSQMVLLKDLGTGGNKRLEACLEIEVMATADEEDKQNSGISTVFYLMPDSRSNALVWLAELDDVLRTKYGRDVVARVPGGDASLTDIAPVGMLAAFPLGVVKNVVAATPGASSTTAVDGLGFATPVPVKRRGSAHSKTSGIRRERNGSFNGSIVSRSNGGKRASRARIEREFRDDKSGYGGSTSTSRSEDVYNDFERMLRQGSRAGEPSADIKDAGSGQSSVDPFGFEAP